MRFLIAPLLLLVLCNSALAAEPTGTSRNVYSVAGRKVLVTERSLGSRTGTPDRWLRFKRGVSTPAKLNFRKGHRAERGLLMAMLRTDQVSMVQHNPVGVPSEMTLRVSRDEVRLSSPVDGAWVSLNPRTGDAVLKIGDRLITGTMDTRRYQQVPYYLFEITAPRMAQIARDLRSGLGHWTPTPEDRVGLVEFHGPIFR